MGVKHYDKTFKEQAVKLSEQRGNISDVARELGVSSSQRTKWRKDFNVYGEHCFPGRGVERLTDEQREIKELRSKLKERELDVEILKKRERNKVVLSKIITLLLFCMSARWWVTASVGALRQRIP